MEFENLSQRPHIAEGSDQDILHLSTATGDYNSSVGDFLGKKLQELRELSGSEIIRRSPTGYTTEAIAPQPRYFPRRQCLQSALCNALGQTAFLEANGFDVSLLASPFAPFIASLSSGFDAAGTPVEQTVAFSETQTTAWTIPGGHSYLWIAKDKAPGEIAFEATTTPPRYDWQDKEPLRWNSTNIFQGGTATASSYRTDANSFPSNPFTGGSSPDSDSGNASSTVWQPATYNTNPINEWLQYDFGAGNEKTIRLLRLRVYESGTFPSLAISVSNDGVGWIKLCNLFDEDYDSNRGTDTARYPYFYIPDHAPARYFRITITSSTPIRDGIRGLLGYEAGYQDGDRHFSIRDKKWEVYSGGSWQEPGVDWICVGEAIADGNGVQELFPYSLRGRAIAYLRNHSLDYQVSVNHNLGFIPRLMDYFYRQEWKWRNQPDPSPQATLPGIDEWGEPLWMRGMTGGFYINAALGHRTWGADVRSVDLREVVLRVGNFYPAPIPRPDGTLYGYDLGEYKFYFDRGW